MRLIAKILYCYKILKGEKSVIGRYVKARIYSNTGESILIRAKVDTGAYTTSIDQELAIDLGFKNLVDLANSDEFKQFINKPQEEVKQKILKIQSDAFNTYRNQYPLLSAVKVVISSNGISIRPNVNTTIQFGGKRFSTDINISDRTHLKNRCIIGRKSLNQFLVDSSQ